MSHDIDKTRRRRKVMTPERKLKNWAFEAFIDYEVDEETGEGVEPEAPTNTSEIMMAIEDLLNERWPRKEGPWGCQFKGEEIDD
jgi:hypothetical protein